MVISPFTDSVDFPSFSLSSNGKQILVKINGYGPPGEMSMGLWEISSWGGGFASTHEGGHAFQSALLGPLYLPVVLTTYAIFGWDCGFAEEWATDWGYAWPE
jgi:hypothetical protein